MGSYIEAIIFSSARTAPPVPDGFTIVPLTAGLSMLPITEDLVRRLDPSAVGDDRIPASWMLKQPVAALARSISADRAVVYIHSETFGGPGTREAIAFRFGKLLYGPAGTSDIEHDLEPGYHLAWGHNNAVNSGLRAIGVHAADEDDEYGTIGLAKHLTTEDWLRDGAGHVRADDVLPPGICAAVALTKRESRAPVRPCRRIAPVGHIRHLMIFWG